MQREELSYLLGAKSQYYLMIIVLCARYVICYRKPLFLRKALMMQTLHASVVFVDIMRSLISLSLHVIFLSFAKYFFFFQSV